MPTRRAVAGCATVAALILVLVTIAGALAYARFSATVLIPDVADLMGDEARGFAVLTLRADDPWVTALLERIDERRRDRADLFPIEIAWVPFGAPDGSDGHVVRIAVSRRGRLVASLLDLILWHAGHSGDANVSRTEHLGEGITSFPGSPVPGFLFVRGTSIVWTPTSASARRAVEVLGRPPGPAARALIERAPEGAPRAILRGALRNTGAWLDRTLPSIPGETLDEGNHLTAAVMGLSFRFETTSADEGAGHVAIDFARGTSPGEIRRVSEQIAGRLEGLWDGELALRTAVRIAGDRATVEVFASGLLSLHDPILSAPEKLREAFRRHAMESDEGES